MYIIGITPALLNRAIIDGMVEMVIDHPMFKVAKVAKLQIKKDLKLNEQTPRQS